MSFFKYEDEGWMNVITDFGMDLASFPYRYTEKNSSKAIRILGILFWVSIYSPILIIGMLIGFVGVIIGIIRDI